MSREAFVEYYQSWLRKPENKASQQKVDSILNEDEFARVAVEEGNAKGFKFSEQEVREVMTASVAKFKAAFAEQKGIELSDEQLEKVAGGVLYSSSSPTVSIYSTDSTSNLAGNFDGSAMDTVMCCW